MSTLDGIIQWLYDPSGLTPHGFCLLWRPGLLWTHALSDLTTGAAYVAISLALAVIIRRRRDLSFRPLAWLFITFILLCGLTHWLDLITLWFPVYGVQGIVKAATATVSVLTAMMLWRLLPAVLKQPSQAQFQKVNDALRTNLEFLDRVGALAGVGGWEIDIASDKVTWSAETYRIHGVSFDHRPTVETGITFYAPEARPVIRAAVEKALADGEEWDLELPFHRADGQRIWVRSMGIVTFVDGKPIRVSGAFQDVTDARNARLALSQASGRAVLAADSGGIGIWEWDLDSNALVWDAWMYRLYGLEPRDEVASYDFWSRHLHPDDRAATEQALHDAIAGLKPYAVRFRIIWEDSSVHHIRGSGVVNHDKAGRPVRVIGANWDISESSRLADELAREHELLRVTLDSIGDGVITTDVKGRVTWLNPVAERMTGWSVADAGARPLAEVFRTLPDHGLAPTDDPPVVENRVLIARHGHEFGIEDSVSPIRDAQGEMFGTVVVFHDVTEQRRLAGEMSHRASHDALTGLVNRAEFKLRLRRSLLKAKTTGGGGAVFCIDLDQFKIVNDTCGHAAGDELLAQVAKLLSDAVRGRDTVARLGGDEFGILLDDCPLGQAQRLAERICDRMEIYRYVHEDRRFRVGASIGVAPLDDRWLTTSALLRAADSASYAAKEAGGNRVRTWIENDETLGARRRQMGWVTELEAALDEDRFILFHQRIQPLQTEGGALHMEVLLRLLDSQGTLTAPGAFLPAAERFQLSSRIDRWVLSRVIHWMQAAPSLARIDTVNVNLSGQSLGDPSFHAWAATALAQAGEPIRRRLCLEITETAAVTNLADAARFIVQMRDMGLRVALDDFGAGASSFGYLKALPVDKIKIDGQFVRDMLTDPLDAAAVRCFVDVAKVVGMKTVAECVERPDTLILLRSMGVDYAQGYLIHRPAPIEAFLAPP